MNQALLAVQHHFLPSRLWHLFHLQIIINMGKVSFESLVFYLAKKNCYTTQAVSHVNSHFLFKVPLGPAGPRGPSAPFWPGIPGSPDGPSRPGCPSFPGGPGGPGRPAELFMCVG